MPEVEGANLDKAGASLVLRYDHHKARRPTRFFWQPIGTLLYRDTENLEVVTKFMGIRSGDRMDMDRPIRPLCENPKEWIEI